MSLYFAEEREKELEKSADCCAVCQDHEIIKWDNNGNDQITLCKFSNDVGIMVEGKRIRSFSRFSKSCKFNQVKFAVNLFNR